MKVSDFIKIISGLILGVSAATFNKRGLNYQGQQGSSLERVRQCFEQKMAQGKSEVAIEDISPERVRKNWNQCFEKNSHVSNDQVHRVSKDPLITSDTMTDCYQEAVEVAKWESGMSILTPDVDNEIWIKCFEFATQEPHERGGVGNYLDTDDAAGSDIDIFDWEFV
ncbi:hypothetical protein JCM33374_g933 [Metschnikowia sp. JCM 33374]|nr:hypothetical protein JCM33374_g933 [Metschnikowia sp. JCM 33374]